MGKFTSGPWHASPTYPCAVYAKGEVLVGLCDGTDGLAERFANARLIAAAPDSHAANLKFVEEIDALYGVTPAWDRDRVYDDLPSTGLAMAYLAARAAIAKATA